MYYQTEPQLNAYNLSANIKANVLNAQVKLNSWTITLYETCFCLATETLNK